jgi:hypothetical protein
MKLLTSDLMQELASVQKTPCLSLYQPTHPILPGNLQDPVRYKDLVKKLEESLKLKYSANQVKELIDPFIQLGNDNTFWRKTMAGLAVLGAPGFFEVIGLPIPVDELAVVANSLHLKPIRQYFQTADRFQILGVSLSEIHFYEGTRHSVAEIELPPDFPKTIEEALGEQHTERYTTSTSLSGPGKANMQHGQGTKKEEADKDAERFFRMIDKLIYEQYSKISNLPLILTALPEYHNLFHKISRNPMLLKDGIMLNPKAVPLEKMKDLAWEIFEPGYNSKVDKLVARFEEATSHGLGSDNINKIARAANDGRIDILLTESGKMIPGKLMDHQVEKGNLIQPDVDDVLDDIGELVSSKGGKVMIIPKEKMPAKTGLAAIYRY